MMNRVPTVRRFFLLASAVFLLSCTLITGSIPAVIGAAANLNPVAFVEPSNTPFLPAQYTDTPIPTATPTNSPLPSATFTATLLPTDTSTSTATNTPVILPTVTPTSIPYIPPTKKPTSKPVILPTSTPKPKIVVQPTATPTKQVVISGVTATLQPTATKTAAPTGENCATFNYDYEAQVASLINAERDKLGFDALALNSILTGTARAHSADMVVNKFMAHEGSDGSTPKDRIRRAGYSGNWWGEIIAGGEPTRAVTWWMNEPGHRDVIVSTHYTDFGVGYAYCAGQGWFTVDFGGP